MGNTNKSGNSSHLSLEEDNGHDSNELSVDADDHSG